MISKGEIRRLRPSHGIKYGDMVLILGSSKKHFIITKRGVIGYRLRIPRPQVEPLPTTPKEITHISLINLTYALQAQNEDNQ